VTWRSVALLGGVALLATGTQLTATATTSDGEDAAKSSAPAHSAAFAPPDDYYKDAEGKTGDELKTALNGIISDNEQLSYDEVWEALKATDEDPENSSNVTLLYTGRSESKDANGGGEGQWNREHV